jgi:hypothetical protein
MPFNGQGVIIPNKQWIGRNEFLSCDLLESLKIIATYFEPLPLQMQSSNITLNEKT